MTPPPETPGDGPPLDLPRLIETLDRHGVEYILVGGAAALSYGAQRPTKDFDCVPQRTAENLRRLADAMRELGTRIRAEGLPDEESKQLPLQLDVRSVGGPEISTWMTDAGGLDVLANIPDRDGGRLPYDALAASAETVHASGIRLRVAAIEHIIASKEWANRPKDREALGELYAIRDAQAAGGAAERSTPLPPRSVTPRPREPD